jgi:hypothetical protein
MRGWRLLIALGALLGSGATLADPYDLQLYKLGNPQMGGAGYNANANARFKQFSMQLAGALNSVSLMPPESLGYSGFAVAAEIGVAPIQQSKVFIPTRSTFEGPLLMPGIHVRKGLPYSIEIGGKLAWIENSGMMAATLEVRWAFLEGFAHLPDASVRGHITRLVNSRELNLTTGGIDLTVGKRLPVGGTVNFTPYAGYNLAFVAANSTTVDFNPTRDPNTSQTSTANALTDTGVFNPVYPGQGVTNRFYIGIQFGVGPFRLGAEGSVTVLGASDVADPQNPGAVVSQGIPVLAAFGASLGFAF